MSQVAIWESWTLLSDLRGPILPVDTQISIWTHAGLNLETSDTKLQKKREKERTVYWKFSIMSLAFFSWYQYSFLWEREKRSQSLVLRGRHEGYLRIAIAFVHVNASLPRFPSNPRSSKWSSKSEDTVLQRLPQVENLRIREDFLIHAKYFSSGDEQFAFWLISDSGHAPTGSSGLGADDSLKTQIPKSVVSAGHREGNLNTHSSSHTRDSPTTCKDFRTHAPSRSFCFSLWVGLRQWQGPH